MKALVVVTLAAAAVAGCTRTVVVERPVPAQTVVEKPVVVERPVVAAAPLRACTFAGAPYSHGSTSCQAFNEFRCTDGSWVETGARC